MTEAFDFSLIDWSRGQFALTAMYHWIFVPLTLGLGFIIAIMETIYVKTGDPAWKRITKFWMTIFGINFAIGVATGIILEFEFGTNWSNYSWFVGDIFGAPLAIEGIMAFFLETTFIAVMFFGWNKVSKRFHLLSTWLVAFGASLSALWILVANAWMQMPVGMKFNPDTARNEMVNFWEVLFSPMAMSKFTHTISSSYLLGAIVVIGISAWFLLKKRHQVFAKRSIVVAAVFGLVTSAFTVLTGDFSAKVIAKNQPMKFAAFEGLYHGQRGAPLVAIGVVSTTPTDPDNENIKDFVFKIEIPNFLSYMAFSDFNAFIPGIKDLMEGNEEHGIMPAAEKISKGKLAIDALAEYKQAKAVGNMAKQAEAQQILEENFKYFGYGYFGTNPDHLVPNVPLTFYSFHIMVALGFWFLLFFAIVLVLVYKDKISNARFWLILAIVNIPLAYLASQSGWVTAEMGRQPWVIQDLMPTMTAVSHLDANAVITTFILFAVVFTTLLIAELKIMFKTIKNGPKTEGGN
ncbi:MAG: cytochrome ubiquinol oxidase subunit I [Lentimicrobium sp.]|jgi:cytochrome d ubiquinol oxidase subunit I|nr:cytochrome ubiquinol oxidase subunit I [Lentimicrobium sp.]MDD2528837.1 cytochrome ubiquinol oxidase subunit I [Lentimicrobiaceae bacterium]MDD4598602.1 cytochrome ubiquinol oxidase subunit I [Lentimicrobiaceae bacterium]MDY0026166.1 cytochrome ubiquinol oxidase subunit I [Lentimicrobium sp.]HAH59355.1 cytochrome ubiquinol oxidase subunit I [Bacteroidales bacterium]